MKDSSGGKWKPIVITALKKFRLVMKTQLNYVSSKEVHLNDKTIIWFNMDKILKKYTKETPVTNKHIKRY